MAYNNNFNTKKIFTNQNNRKESIKIDKVDSFWESKENLIPKKDLFSSFVKGYVDIIKQEQTITTNKDTQIRKFYNEVLRLKMELILNKDNSNYFEKLLPYIKMINAKLAYSHVRKHISENCKNLFTNCINNINDSQDFLLFVDFFEAFIAYYK